MWCDTRMKLTLLVLILCLAEIQAKSVKKIQKEIVTFAKNENVPKRDPKAKAPKGRSAPVNATPAIIAIEIVDPADNTTKSKNSKRTIDSSLGYGYQQNYFGATNTPPKFEIYKYSQHDIPAYRGTTYSNPNGGSSHFSIQKSVTYDLGSTPPQVVHDGPVQHASQSSHPSLMQYYQPGTVLYSALNQQGHLGRLTSQIPQNHGSTPVIFVRVHSNQLSNAGALYPNLPKSHPYSSLNSVNLQALLTNHLTGVLNQQDYANYNEQNDDQATRQVVPQNNQQVYQDYGQTYQQQNYQHQQYQQPHQSTQVLQQQHDDDNASDGLLTHENYPDEDHTRVIFHSTKKQTSKTVGKIAAPIVPNVSSYKGETNSVPQSYSSVEFHTPIQQYIYSNQQQQSESPSAQYIYDTHPQEQNSQVAQYNYNPASHEESNTGYYYPSPAQQVYYLQDTQGQQIQNIQSYQFHNAPDYHIQQNVGANIYDANNPSDLIDTQRVVGEPYNYHAHRSPAPRSRKRNVARKPVIVKKTEKDIE